MALSFAVSIIITRSHRHISMAPATCLAQVLILVFALPFAHPGSVDGRELVLLILLGAGQIGLGLALLSIGARLIPAAEIATITLLEVVLGPLWVWMAVSERPSTATLIGGAIVVAGVLLQAGAEPPGATSAGGHDPERLKLRVGRKRDPRPLGRLGAQPLPQLLTDHLARAPAPGCRADRARRTPRPRGLRRRSAGTTSERA